MAGRKYATTTEYSFSSSPSKYIVVDEDSIEHKWMELLKHWDSRQDALKKLIRHGVPDSLRSRVWKKITNCEDLAVKNPTVYHMLQEQEVDSEVLKMIKQDIRRTFPKQIEFKGFTMQGAMQCVLRAFSALDPHIGYCQGMSFVCGVLLYHQTEEEAFWMLVQLIKTPPYRLGELYQPGLPLLKSLITKLEKLIQILMPNLYLHLKQEAVSPLMYASEWFSTVFSYNFPLEYTARLWDVFLLEGVDYLLNICLALLYVSQENLLKLKFEKIILFLKERGQHVVVDADFFGLCDSFPVTAMLKSMEMKEAHLKEQIQLHKATDPTTPLFVRRRRASSATNFDDLGGFGSHSDPETTPPGSPSVPVPSSPRQSLRRSGGPSDETSPPAELLAKSTSNPQASATPPGK